MRRLIAGAFQSLDGVIQGPGGPEEDTSGEFRLGGWGVKHFDGDVGAFMDAMMGGEFELLLARRTFDIMAAHWPRAAGDPFADRLNRIAKHVVTSRPDVSAWNNSHALSGIAAVAALKQSEGPDLIVQGSGTLHGPLLAAGLIDRLFLLTFPVVIGRGKRLFDRDAGSGRFTLGESRVSPSGVLMAVYDAAGAVETASFGLEGSGEASSGRA